MKAIGHVATFVLVMVLAVGLPAAEKAAPNWSECELVFSGKLDQVVAGPVGRSYPPMYTHRLHFTVEKALRGGLKPGEKVVCSHVARQHNQPAFPEGKVCLVAASKARGEMRAEFVREADAEGLAAAAAACSLPLGWTIEGGKPVSPWAAMGAAAWPAGLGAGVPVKCGKTGRPALLAGPGVTFSVEPVPPEKAIQWTNPDGDGLYKVTVSNAGDRPAKVPALLWDGQRILWEESLVVLCQGRAYPCPGSQGVSGKVEPAQIPAGGNVSTVVNVFRLQGPEWPRGGYRIEFQFCLGEKGQTKSFYYMSRHHDKLREAARSGKPAPAEGPGPKAPSGGKPAAGKGRKLPSETYSGYFVSNRFEPNAAASFLVIADQKQFDAVFAENGKAVKKLAVGPALKE